MSRKYKRRIRTQPVEEANFDIDLSPLLALMVTLIPMMLLATVFVKVTIIETPLPQAVQQALKEDRNKKNREVSIELNMLKGNHFLVSVRRGGRSIYRKRIDRGSFSEKLKELHNELVSVKRNHLKTFQIQFKPSEDVVYEDIVKVMDEVRELKPQEEKFKIFDKKENKMVEMKLMFPDIIFSNVIEG